MQPSTNTEYFLIKTFIGARFGKLLFLQNYIYSMKTFIGARFDQLLFLLNYGTRKLLPHGTSQFKVTLFAINPNQKETLKYCKNHNCFENHNQYENQNHITIVLCSLKAK